MDQFTNEELGTIADAGTHALALYETFPKVLRVNNQPIDVISMSARVSMLVVKARGILSDNMTKELEEKKKLEAEKKE